MSECLLLCLQVYDDKVELVNQRGELEVFHHKVLKLEVPPSLGKGKVSKQRQPVLSSGRSCLPTAVVLTDFSIELQATLGMQPHSRLQP